MSGEPELLDAFKTAALSVTKLYKISASTQAKSRADGYHDCLEDLISFLDKEGLGTADGEGSRIRRWAMERMEGRDAISQTLESEDEVDKPDVQSPQTHRASSAPQPTTTIRTEIQMKDPDPPNIPRITQSSPEVEEPEIVVPSQETFTFQSPLPYPQEAYMNLANLDLSDSQIQTPSNRPAPAVTTPRNMRNRNVRTGNRTSLGRGAGQKRKVNLAEIFDLGSLGNGKDVFGSGGGKRSRLG